MMGLLVTITAVVTRRTVVAMDNFVAIAIVNMAPVLAVTEGFLVLLVFSENRKWKE